MRIRIHGLIFKGEKVKKNLMYHTFLPTILTNKKQKLDFFFKV